MWNAIQASNYGVRGKEMNIGQKKLLPSTPMVLEDIPAANAGPSPLAIRGTVLAIQKDNTVPVAHAHLKHCSNVRHPTRKQKGKEVHGNKIRGGGMNTVKVGNRRGKNRRTRRKHCPMERRQRTTSKTGEINMHQMVMWTLPKGTSQSML